jgi:hypothetical protein
LGATIANQAVGGGEAIKAGVHQGRHGPAGGSRPAGRRAAPRPLPPLAAHQANLLQCDQAAQHRRPLQTQRPHECRQRGLPVGVLLQAMQEAEVAEVDAVVPAQFVVEFQPQAGLGTLQGLAPVRDGPVGSPASM